MGKKLSLRAERILNTAELLLRILALVLALLVVIRMVTAKQTMNLFGLNMKASFTSTQATVFLVIAYAHASGYSALQCGMCILNNYNRKYNYYHNNNSYSMSMGMERNRVMATACYVGDVLVACVAVAAMAAALQVGMISRNGLDSIGWMAVCKFVSDYCNKTSVAVVASLFGAISLVCLSLISSFRYFRLLHQPEPQPQPQIQCQSQSQSQPLPLQSSSANASQGAPAASVI